MDSDDSIREGYFHVIDSPRTSSSNPPWYTQEMAAKQAERASKLHKQIMMALAAGIVVKHDSKTYG